MTATAATPAITTAQVRRVLKRQDLPAAEKFKSTNITGGFTSVTRNGWALTQEREYRMKQWHQTGRVVVDFLASAWHLEQHRDQNEQSLHVAREALQAAGFTVSRTPGQQQLVVRA